MELPHITTEICTHCAEPYDVEWEDDGEGGHTFCLVCYDCWMRMVDKND